MEIRLSRSVRFTTAVCRYRDGESSGLGRAAVKNEKLTDPVRTDSLCQQVIKLAIYRAVLRGGHQKPVWGALTGVRPGKLMYPLLLSGLSEQEALRQFETGYDVSHERAQLCLDASRATLKADRLLQPKDVCLYVGIPFCPTRCAYCSFVSQSTEKSLSMIAPFLEALDREIDAVAEQVRQTGLRVVSLYMGGGTPTTLTSAQLDSLLTKLETAFDLSGLRECTVEAGRPDTITAEKLAVLRRHGTDRVSVNPQNMDLIAGLPTDSVEGFSRTVDAVLELEPENITVHTLSIKRGARLHFGEESLPTDGEVKAMLDYAGAGLRADGYSPYYLYRQKNMSGGFENTGWTKPGRENLYNICIMEELCSILALGAGGSTKLVRRDGGKNERFVAPKYPAEYIADIDRICRDKEKISRFYGNAVSI